MGVFLDDINLATDVGRKFSHDGFVAMEEADAIPRLLFSLEAEHKAESARFHFVEIFAGQGNLSRELLRAGWEGVAVDIRYGPDHDVCHVRGFRMAINAVCETRNQGLVWFGNSMLFLRPAFANTVLEGTSPMTGWEMNTDRWQPDKAMSSCM